MIFEGYSDPERCEKILNEYIGDLEGYGLEKELNLILIDCKDSVQLDTRLDRLITSTHQMHGAIGYGRVPLDEDSGGYGSLARKILEDGV